jgi:hypothetical protein
LKIITLSNLFFNTYSNSPSNYSIAAIGGYILKSKKVFNVILTNPASVEYPDCWHDASRMYAHRWYLDKYIYNYSSPDVWDDSKLNVVSDFYDSIQKALPIMLAYRYQT